MAIRTRSASDTTSIFWMTRAQSATETGTGFDEYRTKSVAPQALLQLVARPTLDLEAAEHEPPLGSHVVTPRRGHLHHGIYVGGCKVLHYAGLARGLHRGALEEVLLAPFTQGRRVWIRSYALPSFDCREVIRRRDSPVTVTRPVPAAAL